MYLINTQEIVKELRQNRVNEIERLVYQLAFVTLLVVGLATVLTYGVQMSDLLVLLFYPIVVNWFQIENAKGDGKDFWTRYMITSVPIIVQITLALFVANFVLGLLDPNYFAMIENHQESFLKKVVVLIIFAAFFYKQKLMFQMISSKPAAATKPAVKATAAKKTTVKKTATKSKSVAASAAKPKAKKAPAKKAAASTSKKAKTSTARRRAPARKK